MCYNFEEDIFYVFCYDTEIDSLSALDHCLGFVLFSSFHSFIEHPSYIQVMSMNCLYL